LSEQPQQPQQPSQPPQQPPQPPNPAPGYGYPNYPNAGSSPYAAPGQPGQPGQPDAYGYPQAGSPQAGYPQAGYQQAGYQQPGYPAPGAVPPGSYTGDPNAPYGYDPFGRPYSDKSKIVAGILSLTLGTLGVGRFYIGHVGLGLAQLFTCGGLGIWALIDGIMLLTGSNTTDSKGRVLRG
jgi:TM2 domain